eukprot:2188112-Amphidinium_carterae.3
MLYTGAVWYWLIWELPPSSIQGAKWKEVEFSACHCAPGRALCYAARTQVAERNFLSSKVHIWVQITRAAPSFSHSFTREFHTRMAGCMLCYTETDPS